MTVIAHGLDYARFKLFGVLDENFVRQRFAYIDVYIRMFHGSRFLDLTGKQLELIRMFEDVDVAVREMAHIYPVNRIDVFVDVEGAHLGDVEQRGTVISNAGTIETIYSHHLKTRGDRPSFGRAYDARAAGHYLVDVTRYEVEYKREHARALLGSDGWKVDPLGVTVRCIKAMFGVDVGIEGVKGVDLNAPQRRMS
ncbi:MAG: hypothetical protein V3S69_07250, partial [Dehalococcoidales bacterium]